MTLLKRYLFFLVGMTLASAGYIPDGLGADNLFMSGKTDSAIKPLVFPQAMVVIRSCHPGCLSLESNQKPVALSPKTTSLRWKKIESLYSNNEENQRKAVKKWLVRLDPARIAPAKAGEDFKAIVSHKNLKQLKAKYPLADLLFLFRQSLVFNREPWAIRTRGLIYLAKQNKLIVMPSNDRDLGPQNELNQPVHTGLEQLALDARKIILSYKFEKRRSNY